MNVKTFEIKGSACKINNSLRSFKSCLYLVIYKEKCLTYTLTLVNSNAIRYCMEPKNNKVTTKQAPYHQTHALMPLRSPVSALKLLVSLSLSVEAPTTTLLFSQCEHQSPQQQLHPSQESQFQFLVGFSATIWHQKLPCLKHLPTSP